MIDLGNILLADLQTEDNPVGRQYISVEIVCDSPTMVGFSMVDNRAGSVAPVRPIVDDDFAWLWEENDKFGLGKTSDGVNIGAYTFFNLYYNQVSHYNNTIAYSDDGGKEWTVSPFVPLQSNGSRIVSVIDKFSKFVAPVTKVTYTFVVSAAVQGPNELRLTENTSLDGSATMSLVYL